MKILHSYCLNYNLGDYFLGIGLKNLLRKYLDISFIGNTNIQGREFNSYYIKEVVNKRYDLLVIGGGGIIHGSHWPNGWFWLIEKELIKTIEIPFIVYGAGNNYWDKEGAIPQRALEHLDETIERSLFFSVRNDGSAYSLRNNLKNYQLIHTVPDPGFHINLDTDYCRKINDPYVIVQLANDKQDIRFLNQECKTNFIKNLREVVKILSKHYKILFTPHVFDDLELSIEIAKGIDNTEIWDFGYFAFDNIKEAVGYYKYAKFVLAMRGHGQIVPIAFNTPTISLGNHPKHLGLMKELDLMDYYLDISNNEFVPLILNMIKKIEENYVIIKSKYNLINQRLLKNTDNSFKYIVKELNKNDK